MQFIGVRGIVFVLLFTMAGSGLASNHGLLREDKPEEKTKKAAKNEGPEKKANRLALINATIHPMNAKAPFVGSLLILNDKIEEVGSDIKIPAGVKTIDLKGFHITPGLIESRGKLWLTSAATRDGSSNPTLEILNGVDTYSDDWKELAAQGITSVFVQPNTTGSLGGYGVVMRVGPHGSVDDIVLKKEVGIQASIGITATTSNARYAQVQALKKKLEGAKEKKKEAAKKTTDTPKDKKDEKAEGKKPVESKKKSTEKKDEKKASEKEKKEEDKKKEDPAKLALRKVLNREIPLHVEVHHSDAVRHLIKMGKDLNIRLVLSGLSKASSAVPLILESGYPVTVGPLFETSTPPAYRKNACFDWLEEAADQNVLWAVGTFSNSGRSSQQLRHQTAYARRLGAGARATLAAVTSNAARLLGISQQVGTLEKGKEADLAVFAGDPLDPSTAVRLVMSRGVVTFESDTVASNQTAAKPELQKSMPQQMPKAFVLQSQRVWNGKAFVPLCIVIRDGKIQRLAKNPPKNLPAYDVGNSVITPGLVVGQTSMGQGSELTDTTESDMSHVRAGDAFNPTTKACREMLSSGFIHLGVSPSATVTSPGALSHIRLGSTVGNSDTPVMANLFGLGTESRNRQRFPASLPGQVQMLNNMFEGGLTPSTLYVSSDVANSIAEAKQAAIEEVKIGTRKAIFAATSNREIRTAIELVKSHKLSACLRTRERVQSVAKELVTNKVGLVIPSLNGQEYREQVEDLVATLKTGVAFSFAGDNADAIRGTAASLVGAGLDSNKVMKALTASGSKLVGMNKTALAKSLPADLVIWSEPPTKLSAIPLVILVDGQLVTEK